MNKINVKGRLVRNAEVKETANGKIVTFRLADEHRKNGAVVNVQYIDCVVANKNVDAFETLKQGAFVNGDGILIWSVNRPDQVRINIVLIFLLLLGSVSLFSVRRGIRIVHGLLLLLITVSCFKLHS